MDIALIAHDKKKPELVALVKEYEETLKNHTLYATGTTGRHVEEGTGLSVHRFRSGPLGGDQQIGAYVSDHKIDLVLFIRDPLTPQPHEPDVSALYGYVMFMRFRWRRMWERQSRFFGR